MPTCHLGHKKDMGVQRVKTNTQARKYAGIIHKIAVLICLNDNKERYSLHISPRGTTVPIASPGPLFGVKRGKKGGGYEKPRETSPRS